jgi:hypothetical protein
MTETEISFDPDTFRTEEQRRLHRTDEQIRADVANNPLHQMPKFITRHEPAIEIQRRGHLLPDEWADHRPIPNNNEKFLPNGNKDIT